MAAIRAHITQQAQVGAQRLSDGAGFVAPLGRDVQGLPAGPSLTVAMLSSAKPSRPSTSMAVITDWCVARRIRAERHPDGAIRAGFLQQRGTQGLGTGVDELLLVHAVGALLGHGDHQGLALRGLWRNRIRLRKVHAHAALVRETAREHEEDDEQQDDVDQRDDVDLRLFVSDGASGSRRLDGGGVVTELKPPRQSRSPVSAVPGLATPPPHRPSASRSFPSPPRCARPCRASSGRR